MLRALTKEVTASAKALNGSFGTPGAVLVERAGRVCNISP
jgi:hypothetical protein